MAPRGRPPKPIEAKRRAGNPGKRALPNGAGLAAVPAIIEAAGIADLDPLATLDTVLAAARPWLALTDGLAVVILRQTLEERTEVRGRAMAGSVEARKELRDLDRQLIGLLAQLGFDPAARARLGLAEVKAASKLEQLRQARATR